MSDPIDRALSFLREAEEAGGFTGFPANPDGSIDVSGFETVLFDQGEEE